MMLPAGSIVGALYHKLSTQSSAPEDGRIYRPKHVEPIGIINKPLLLYLVGCLCYRASCYSEHASKFDTVTLYKYGLHLLRSTSSRLPADSIVGALYHKL
jgi:hypothetical protein